MPKDKFLARVGVLKAKEDQLRHRSELVDPTASHELARLGDRIATIKHVLDTGKLIISNSGVGGLTFDPDKPLTYTHDLHNLWEGKADEERVMPSANIQFQDTENGIKFSCSAEWWDWARYD